LRTLHSKTKKNTGNICTVGGRKVAKCVWRIFVLLFSTFCEAFLWRVIFAVPSYVHNVFG